MNQSTKKILDELCCLEKKIASLASSLRYSDQTETALQEYGEQLPSFPISSTQNWQVLDENGCLLAVNDVWLQTLGYTREGVIGRWFGDYLYPPDISLFTQNLLCVGKTGEISMIVVRMARNDGAVIIVSFKGTIGHDKYGIFRQIHCTFEDITDFIRQDDVRDNREHHFPLTGVAMELVSV
jgi:PAS domain S-box-containing protein